jgi:tRNA(adenine34) deaminase
MKPDPGPICLKKEFSTRYNHVNSTQPPHLIFMSQALETAKRAAELGEAPVGAIVVVSGQVIASAHNRIELDNDPTAHAEILAIRSACEKLGDWRLSEAVLYVTLEPCVMCAAALIHSRIRQVVYGARDHRWGGFGSLFDLAHDPRLNHEIEVIPGIMEADASDLLTQFFKDRRQNSFHFPPRRDARVAEGG